MDDSFLKKLSEAVASVAKDSDLSFLGRGALEARRVPTPQEIDKRFMSLPEKDRQFITRFLTSFENMTNHEHTKARDLLKKLCLARPIRPDQTRDYNNLCTFEKRVIDLYFGFGSSRDYSVKEIAAMFARGTPSRRRIEQIKRALTHAKQQLGLRGVGQRGD